MLNVKLPHSSLHLQVLIAKFFVIMVLPQIPRFNFAEFVYFTVSFFT